MSKITLPTSTSAMLAEVVSQPEKKTGNTDFALHHIDGQWYAEYGNTCEAVMLGESQGHVQTAWKKTPAEAIEALLAQLREQRK